MNYLQHNGYYGSAQFSEEDMVFHGKIEFIRALVSYEAEDAKGLKAAFIEAVEDYLAMCEGENIEPEKPFKGSFQVRIKPELHRRLAIAALKDNKNINKFINETLEQKLKSGM